jgi:hypothetical protein
VGENLDDDRGIFSGRQDDNVPPALGTGGDVDGEDTVESLGPTHARPACCWAFTCSEAYCVQQEQKGEATVRRA